MFVKYDRNDDSVIDFMEFLDMFSSIKEEQKFGETEDHAKGSAATVAGTVGTHTYLFEELNVCTRVFNKVLADDEFVKDRMPMSVNSEDLFHGMSDGMMLIRLLDQIDPDCIDMRTVNKGANLNIYKVRENINLALTTAKGKIKLIGIEASTFLEKKPHMLLGVCWQLARQLQTATISLREC